MGTRGRPRTPDVLTPRQYEVLELLREGLTNEQIGSRLGISTDGAKFHVSEIITRLGVSTRREAAGWHRERDERAARSPQPTASLRLAARRPLLRRFRRHARAHRPRALAVERRRAA